MKTKVHGGTPVDGGTSLCVTCHFSTITRGRGLNEEIVECNVSMTRGRLIPFKVTSCSAYSDARLPSYSEMLRTAWILTPHSKRRPAGFIRATDLDAGEFRQILMEGEKEEWDH
jgi:hypothetical protein